MSQHTYQIPLCLHSGRELTIPTTSMKVFVFRNPDPALRPADVKLKVFSHSQDWAAFLHMNEKAGDMLGELTKTGVCQSAHIIHHWEKAIKPFIDDRSANPEFLKLKQKQLGAFATRWHPRRLEILREEFLRLLRRREILCQPTSAAAPATEERTLNPYDFLEQWIQERNICKPRSELEEVEVTVGATGREKEFLDSQWEVGVINREQKTAARVVAAASERKWFGSDSLRSGDQAQNPKEFNPSLLIDANNFGMLARAAALPFATTALPIDSHLVWSSVVVLERGEHSLAVKRKSAGYPATEDDSRSAGQDIVLRYPRVEMAVLSSFDFDLPNANDEDNPIHHRFISRIWSTEILDVLLPWFENSEMANSPNLAPPPYSPPYSLLRDRSIWIHCAGLLASGQDYFMVDPIGKMRDIIEKLEKEKKWFRRVDGRRFRSTLRFKNYCHSLLREEVVETRRGRQRDRNREDSTPTPLSK